MKREMSCVECGMKIKTVIDSAPFCQHCFEQGKKFKRREVKE